MPQEDRLIIFDYEEVYKAIFALCTQKQIKKPPPGTVKKVSKDEKDNDVIILQLENPQDKTEAQVEYSRDFLAAALLLFCRGLGIPLPKSARKSVMIKDNQVMLRVQI